MKKKEKRGERREREQRLRRETEHSDLKVIDVRGEDIKLRNTSSTEYTGALLLEEAWSKRTKALP